MTPDQLRNWSLKTFKATVYCFIAGIFILLAAPKPGFGDPAQLIDRLPAVLGYSLVLIAMLTNFVSLLNGVIAWVGGTKHCAWIFISLLLVLIPIGLSLSLLL